MKRWLVILILVATVAVNQAIAAPAFGLLFGPAFANAKVSPDDGVPARTRVGVAGGLTTAFSLGRADQWFLRFDLLYSQKGWTQQGDDGFGETAKITWKTDELTFAPTLQRRFPTEKNSYFIELGPEIGFNTTHKADIEAYGISVGAPMKNWRSTSLSLNVGTGVAVRAGKGEIIVGARYNHGLMNMYTGGADPDTGENLKITESSIHLLFGYNFTVPTFGK